VLATIIILIIVVLVAIYVIASYNGMIKARNAYKNAFAQIDVQLTRRHDLIPNLVETAKGYLAHERETLDSVTRARTDAINGLAAAKAKPGDPNAMRQLAGSENTLTQALGRLFAVSQAYPDLKASENMMQLSGQLTSTENHVAVARQAYNDSVLTYNNMCETFPPSLISRLFGFGSAQQLEIEGPAMREVPRVSFS
jgi:LemA protein